jgi:hypothetical protein
MDEDKSIWDRIKDAAGDGVVGWVGNIFSPGLPGTQQQQQQQQVQEKSGLAAVPTWAWVVGGVAVTGLVVYLVARKS